MALSGLEEPGGIRLRKPLLLLSPLSLGHSQVDRQSAESEWNRRLPRAPWHTP